MRKIIIGFSSPKEFKIGAELIKLWLGTPYSHVYINWTDDQGRDIIWQASHGCVHTILKDNFLLTNDIIEESELEFSEEEYQKLRDFCYYYSGSLYATCDLFIIVAYDILIRIGFKPIFKDTNGFICSELVSLMLNKIKKIQLPKESYLMRPDDVEELISVI